VLERLPDAREGKRLPNLKRAAASPSAIVLAGAGVAAGELAHFGIAVAVVLGAVGYGGRLGWAALRRRAILRRRARQSRIDPWSLPEPWRGYVARSIDARKRARQLALSPAPGPVADHLKAMLGALDTAVQEHWALAQAGAALAGSPGRAERVSQELARVQGLLSRSEGANRAALATQEQALASELRSLRQTEAVAGEASLRLGTSCSQLEAVVAAAGRLVTAAGAPAASDLASLQTELASLTAALEEARRAAGGPLDGRSG
jgi:hypothetical protein